MNIKHIILFAFALPNFAFAQEANQAACTVKNVANIEATQTAANNNISISEHSIVLGKATQINLVPVANVELRLSGDKPNHGEYAGLFQINAPSDGIYRIKLGSRGWLDVIGTQIIASNNHARGTSCDWFHKYVDFNLTSGSYIVQISGDAPQSTIILIEKIG